MKNKIALITGVSGQDGSYLAEFLLGKGYEVHGLVRRSSTSNTSRIEHLIQGSKSDNGGLILHNGDMTDAGNLRNILDTIEPDEVYNLAAQSHVGISFEVPIFTADVVAVSALRLLEAIRGHQDRTGRCVRYYQASSSEMFGNVREVPQTESTPFYPRSPYGVSKVFAYWATVNYREAYGIHATNGILFNHESPRRGENFVTRKITRAVGRIKHKLQDKLFLGNLDAKRDWGFAGDYVEAMWLMVQPDKPDDYVVASGKTHSVREFLELAFGQVDLDYRDFVEIDPKFFRPTEVELLLGDASKARKQLGWEPKVGLQELATMMVEHDLQLAAQEKTLCDAGYEIPQLRAA